jgi:hypothetical protein
MAVFASQEGSRKNSLPGSAELSGYLLQVRVFKTKFFMTTLISSSGIRCMSRAILAC